MDDSPDDTVQLDAPELTRPVDRLVRTFSWRARQKAKKTDPSASERADDVPDDATAAAPEDLGRTLTRVLSFGRRNKQARQSDDGGKDDEDLDRTTSMFSGPRRAFSLTRRPAASAGTRFSALRLSETEHVYGPLQVRRAEKRGQKPAPRYCVLGKETCVLTWYATASTEAPSNGQRPDGSCTIALADGAPATPDLFHVQSHEGEAFECRAASAEEAARWKRSLDAITSRAISGYIQIKGRRGWKRRWVLFQPLCKKLCIYRAQPLVAHSAGTFADAHIYQQPGYRAHGEVKWAARRPSPSQPFGFSIFTPDEGQWELAAPTAKEMRRWLDSLPIFDPEAAVAPTPRGPAGGGGGGADGFAKPLATARNLHKNIVNAIGEEYHAEKERRQSVRLSLRSSVSSSAPTSPARESPASSPAKVGAGAKSAAEPAPLAEVSDSASESDDDDDADSAAAEAPKPLQLGISGRDLVTHAKPVLPLAKRIETVMGDAEQVAGLIQLATPRQGSAAAAGAITPRSNRLVSDQLRQLEEMRQQLEALRNENRELKLQTGGELSADQDEKVLQEFLVKLRAVLEMRSEGRFEQQLFDEYNGGLVQLSDEHLRELYSSFMLIYVEEYDEAVLERLGIGEPDETTVGFAEMMTIKLGELMDQPRQVRIQAFQAAQKKKEDQAKELLKKKEREKEEAAKMAAQVAVNGRIASSMKKYWAALSNGEGDVSEVRRFRRKPELGLLVSSTEDIKKISPYNWRNMGCSGLTEQELRCLLVRLGEPGMPGQADEFKKMIIARLGTKSPTDAQVLAMCSPPGAAKAPPPPPPPPGGGEEGRHARVTSIPTELAAGLIGRQGAAISRMQEDSGASINISKPQPGDASQRIDICASSAAAADEAVTWIATRLTDLRGVRDAQERGLSFSDELKTLLALRPRVRQQVESIYQMCGAAREECLRALEESGGDAQAAVETLLLADGGASGGANGGGLPSPPDQRGGGQLPPPATAEELAIDLLRRDARGALERASQEGSPPPYWLGEWVGRLGGGFNADHPSLADTLRDEYGGFGKFVEQRAAQILPAGAWQLESWRGAPEPTAGAATAWSGADKPSAFGGDGGGGPDAAVEGNAISPQQAMAAVEVLKGLYLLYGTDADAWPQSREQLRMTKPVRDGGGDISMPLHVLSKCGVVSMEGEWLFWNHRKIAGEIEDLARAGEIEAPPALAQAAPPPPPPTLPPPPPAGAASIWAPPPSSNGWGESAAFGDAEASWTTSSSTSSAPGSLSSAEPPDAFYTPPPAAAAQPTATESPAAARPPEAAGAETLPEKVERIRETLNLAPGGLVKIVKEAHAALGLTPEGGLIQQTDFLLLKLFG